MYSPTKDNYKVRIGYDNKKKYVIKGRRKIKNNPKDNPKDNHKDNPKDYYNSDISK